MSKQEKEMQVSVVEKLAVTDKAAMDMMKTKAEVALEKAKAAVAQSETAKLAYDNVILQLALKYKLSDGDLIEDSGEIKRNSQLQHVAQFPTPKESQ